MIDHSMYYDTLVRVTNAISECKEPEDVALITVESVKTAFNAKGCSVFLVNRATRELGLAASFGLSKEYLEKGPIYFMQSINEAKERIQGGTSIMFFPEGTRSNDGRLLDFKKGAFKLAVDMKLPILPVTIINTRNILPSNSTALFPGRAKLVIHEAIDIVGYSDDNLEELMARARQAIQKGLDHYA